MNRIKKIIKKNNGLFNFFSWIKLYFIFLYYTIFMYIFRIFPIKNNRIMFISYYGKGYGDNAKYVCNELLKNREKYELIWGTKRKFKESLPDGVRYVCYGSLKYLYYLSTAKIWINNTRCIYGVKKRKKQYYIQTWHSSLRLKTIERDAEEYLKKQYILAAKNDSKICNLIISGCKFSSDIYHESFWYDGEILETGTPRCDIFFNEHEDIINNVYKYFKIDRTKKIILYAPTFRKNDINCNNFFNYSSFIEKINEKKQDYILLVRFHPNSNTSIKCTKNIYDATKYPDMQELIVSSDILITDYSGCCFDAMIAKKKCILYVKDLEQYMKTERSLYFDFEELPFKKIKTEEDLTKEIINFNYEKYLDRIEIFDKKIGNNEHGNAAELIVERINKVINNEKI